ncbi:M14 family zinc carboxypeptidase [Halomarina ordinaria]|uniref:M14 family zinc carboxypeptidase n=1 Tax=Halomarina ordinaria TaxID=3033939 RepID=A0ABD5U8K1_9EURY|nr:M14 family zinc carboxypeptidase [Halomarina sp. PSRA2]
MELTRRTTLKALGGLLAAGTLGSSTAGASPSSDRRSRERVALDYLSNDDLLDNDELESVLRALRREYPEHVRLKRIGRSNQRRSIWAVSVGNVTGDDGTDVMAIGQQHGDEMVSSAEGLLSAVQFVASDPSAEAIRENLTLHVVPRANPDGFVARQRYNVDTHAPAAGDDDGIFGGDTGFYTAGEEGVGWDVNRYHWDDWTESNLYQALPEEYPVNPVVEAQALLDAVERVDPDWIIDYHRQGTYCVDPDATFDPENPGEAYERGEYPPSRDDDGGGELVTTSVFWPINEDVPQEAQDLSKRLVWTMTEALTAFDRSTVTRYPGGTYAGIARNAYGLQGRGSVLYELSAGTLGDREFRVRQVFESLLSCLDATADGSLDDVDPENVTQLPERETNGFTV